ncbi:MAG: hypothetical protein HeimC3_10400 [Candidatus Heimdallarchaeota archaeon LC_3]|nr:MAG: hypothetical protein HeimC3_10400 [Candidatus Heimdallarchaeota archaeon LC_3]
MNVDSDLNSKLTEVGKTNPQIKTISIINNQGILLAGYNSSGAIEDGEQTRLGAMILACQSLTNKTLLSLSYDKCKVFTVKAENANTGMIFSEKYNILVITETKSDIKSLTLSIHELIQKLMDK